MVGGGGGELSARVEGERAMTRARKVRLQQQRSGVREQVSLKEGGGEERDGERHV